MKINLNDKIVANISNIGKLNAETNAPLNCADVECFKLDISCKDCILNKKSKSYKPIKYYDLINKEV